MSLKNALRHWFPKEAPTWEGSCLVWAPSFCWPPTPPPENFMRVQLVPKNKIGNFLLPFFTIQFIKIQDCVICILQLALAWHASDSFPEISTVGRTRTVIYVYIRLIDTPFYYFILKIIKIASAFFCRNTHSLHSCHAVASSIIATVRMSTSTQSFLRKFALKQRRMSSLTNYSSIICSKIQGHRIT